MAESEAQLERQLLGLCETKGYEFIRIENQAELEANFRLQFERLNAKKFAAKPLSDSEWRRFYTRFKAAAPFACASMLRQKQVLERDDSTKVHVMLLDTKDWRNNHWQVSNQITIVGARENRYDVTLLVNGLPLVQIELKRRGVAINEALHQINRYRRESYGNLFNFVQFFIISNGTNTRYFANSNSSLPIPYTSTFNWTNEHNGIISDLLAFGDSFLPRSHVHMLLTEGMLLRNRDSASTAEQDLRILRPYQLYGCRALVDQVRYRRGNAHLWHATGSGKTTTYFKTAQVIADEIADVAKVFALVDRRDLNGQSIEEFNAYYPGFVSEEQDSRTLRADLLDDSKRVVVAMIHKLVHLVKTDNPAVRHLKNKRVVFLVDECHRSQFGEMQRELQGYFKDLQLLGFTGTPRFAENHSQDGRTTADVFGECVHSYLMKDAIRDKNVLPFRVDHMNMLHTNEHFTNERVAGVDLREVTLSDKWISAVVERVGETYAAKTNGGRYGAMLAVESIKHLGLYYAELRLQQPELKITGVFSYEANEVLGVGEESGKELLARMISDYNAAYGTSFDLGSKAAYSADLARRFKRRSALSKEEQVDLLLVVDMYLTGADFPQLNTLYYDKSSRHHTLVQHISRTNRVEGDAKPYGEIVLVRPLEKELTEALRLFSNTDDVSTLLARPYAEVLAELRAAVAELLILAPTAAQVDLLEGESEQVAFVHAFQQIAKLQAEMRPNVDFDFDAEFSPRVSEEELANYRGKYLDIHAASQRPENKVSILAELDFKLELIRTDIINVDYFKQLLAQVQVGPEPDPLLKRIEQDVARSDNEQLRLKREYILRFLNEVAPHLPQGANTLAEFDQFERQEFERELQQQAAATDISADQIGQWISSYEYDYHFPKFSKHIKNKSFTEMREVATGMREFIVRMVATYA